MAITNKAIIDAYKAAQGISMDAPLFTYASWLKQGCRVRKGEKCHHRVPLYKHTTKTIERDGQEQIVGRCFIKTANLFELSQVERMDRHEKNF